LGKAYGIKPRCYWEHIRQPIWEHIGNNGIKTQNDLFKPVSVGYIDKGYSIISVENRDKYSESGGIGLYLDVGKKAYVANEIVRMGGRVLNCFEEFSWVTWQLSIVI